MTFDKRTLTHPALAQMALLAALTGLGGASAVAADAPSVSGATDPCAEMDELQPGDSWQDRQIGAGEVHAYRPVAAPADRRRLVVVEQVRADVRLLLFVPPSLSAPRLVVDSPTGRDGPEFLLIPEDLPSEVCVEVRAAPTAPTGRYRIRLEHLPTDDLPGRARVAAAESMTRGGVAWASTADPTIEKSSARREALDAFFDGAEQWRRLDEQAWAGHGRYAVGVLHRLVGEREKAEERHRRDLGFWERRGDHGRVADLRHNLGVLRLAGGQPSAGRRWLEKALEAQLLADDPFRQASTLHHLCSSWIYGRHFEQALACYDDALPRIRSAGHLEAEAGARTRMGLAYRQVGEPDDALAAFRDAGRLYRREGRTDRLAQSLYRRATLHRRLGELRSALEIYGEALQLFRQLEDVGWEIRLLEEMGSAHLWLGELDRAEASLVQSLELRKGRGFGGEAETWTVLGGVHLRAGNWIEALDFLRQALVRALETGRPDPGSACERLAEAHVVAGRKLEALELFDRALDGAEATSDPLRRARAFLGRGEVRAATGQRREAAADTEKALELYRSLGIPHGESAALLASARLEQAAGRPQQASERLEEALGRLDAPGAALELPEIVAEFPDLRHRIEEMLGKSTAEHATGVAAVAVNSAAVESAVVVRARRKAVDRLSRWRRLQRRGQEGRLVAARAAYLEALAELEAAATLPAPDGP